jgi:transposase
MMGVKLRAFAPLGDRSLEELVPADSLYRRLERTLDLSFVHDLVADCYSSAGRPSVDPVVFFKLQLIMFLEGIRSERQLMRVVADRLSLRWYLGYDLTEPLPDHSSLTRIRDRFGLERFRRFFAAIVERCIAAGLVWGKELYVDATKVEANASLDSVIPRFAVEAHLHRLFTPEQPASGDEAPAPAPQVSPLPASMVTIPAGENRHDWIAMIGRPQRAVRRWGYERKADWQASRTDPDASVMPTRGGSHLGYHTQYVVDGGKARIILAALVTPSEVMENMPMRDLVWHTCFRWKVRPCQVTGDTTYGTAENIVALEQAGIRAYMPLPDFDRRTAYYGKSAFNYDATQDIYICPQGALLRRSKLRRSQGLIEYRAEGHICNACAVKAACTASDHGRSIHHSLHEAYLDRVRGYHETEAYARAMRKRQVWIEPLFGEAKQWHGLRRFRLCGLEKVNGEALLIAAGQNVKRLLQAVRGRMRPWPSGGQMRFAGTEHRGHIGFSPAVTSARRMCVTPRGSWAAARKRVQPLFSTG